MGTLNRVGLFVSGIAVVLICREYNSFVASVAGEVEALRMVQAVAVAEQMALDEASLQRLEAEKAKGKVQWPFTDGSSKTFCSYPAACCQCWKATYIPREVGLQDNVWAEEHSCFHRWKVMLQSRWTPVAWNLHLLSLQTSGR